KVGRSRTSVAPDQCAGSSEVGLVSNCFSSLSASSLSLARFGPSLNGKRIFSSRAIYRTSARTLRDQLSIYCRLRGKLKQPMYHQTVFKKSIFYWAEPTYIPNNTTKHGIILGAALSAVTSTLRPYVNRFVTNCCQRLTSI